MQQIHISLIIKKLQYTDTESFLAKT